jgi:hypothetical protein
LIEYGVGVFPDRKGLSSKEGFVGLKVDCFDESDIGGYGVALRTLVCLA